jgi:single-strand DNA-binding protein
MINSVTIAGNLGKDAELKSSQSGTAVLRFGVAVNERRKDQQGNWSDYTNWVSCVMFGKRAQAVAQYLTKGTKVSVQGKLHYSSWQGKDGTSRSKLEVMVDELEFMSRENQQQQYQQPVGNDDPTIPF